MPSLTPTNSDAELAPTVAIKKKRGRPKGSKNKLNMSICDNYGSDTGVQLEEPRLTTSAIKFRVLDRVYCLAPTEAVGTQPVSEISIEHADSEEMDLEDGVVAQDDAEELSESWGSDEFADHHEEHGLEPHADAAIEPQQSEERLAKLEAMLKSCLEGMNTILKHLMENQLRQQTPVTPKVRCIL